MTKYCPWNLSFPFCFVDVPGVVCNGDWELNLPRIYHRALIKPLHLRGLLVLGQTYFHQHHWWHLSGAWFTPELIHDSLCHVTHAFCSPLCIPDTLHLYHEFFSQEHSYFLFSFVGLFCHWSHFPTVRAICWRDPSTNIPGSFLCQAVGILCLPAGPPLTSHEQEHCLKTL